MATSRHEPHEYGATFNWGQDRGTLLTGGLLIAVAGVSWAVVVRQPADMPGMPAAQQQSGMGASMGMAVTSTANSLSLAGASAFLAAWAVMMAAMMLPSAAPMIAAFGALYRRSSQTGRRGVPTTVVTLVYLALWAAFGVPAYVASLAISTAAQDHASFATLLPYLLAITLLAAGVYQFTPLKRVCLRVCQHPLAFLMGHWRSGYLGTLKMALQHAAYCIGCCWGLMVVLVAVGAMALPWVLLITVVVFVEKLLPRGEWTARGVGGLLLMLGLLVAVQPHLATTLRGPGM